MICLSDRIVQSLGMIDREGALTDRRCIKRIVWASIIGTRAIPDGGGGQRTRTGLRGCVYRQRTNVTPVIPPFHQPSYLSSASYVTWLCCVTLFARRPFFLSISLSCHSAHYRSYPSSCFAEDGYLDKVETISKQVAFDSV